MREHQFTTNSDNYYQKMQCTHHSVFTTVHFDSSPFHTMIRSIFSPFAVSAVLSASLFVVMPVAFVLAAPASTPSVTETSVSAAAVNDSSVRIETVDPSLMTVQRDFLVSPSRIAITVKPGSSKTTEISVLNREGKRMSYTILRQDFSSDQQSDDIKIYSNVDGPYSARGWVRQTKDFTLEYGQRAYIPITVNVPEKPSVGDHYTVLLVQRAEPADATGINIMSQVGILFLITVDGEVVKSGELTSFSSWYPLYWSRKASFSLKYKNTGNVFLMPTGKVRIANIFGVTVDEIPVKDWYVYRESSRGRVLNWQPRFALGRYTATLMLTDAAHDASNEIIASTSFWILPIIPLIIILVVIFCASLLWHVMMSRFEIRRKTARENDVARGGSKNDA